MGSSKCYLRKGLSLGKWKLVPKWRILELIHMYHPPMHYQLQKVWSERLRRIRSGHAKVMILAQWWLFKTWSSLFDSITENRGEMYLFPEYKIQNQNMQISMQSWESKWSQTCLIHSFLVVVADEIIHNLIICRKRNKLQILK